MPSPVCAGRSWKPWPKPWFDEISPNWLHFSLFLFMFYFHISPGMSLLCWSAVPSFIPPPFSEARKKKSRAKESKIHKFISCDPGRESAVRTAEDHRVVWSRGSLPPFADICPVPCQDMPEDRNGRCTQKTLIPFVSAPAREREKREDLSKWMARCLH